MLLQEKNITSVTELDEKQIPHVRELDPRLAQAWIHLLLRTTSTLVLPCKRISEEKRSISKWIKAHLEE
jgi:hypothetical protein